MKVFFLDIDGVLNHQLFYEQTMELRESGLLVPKEEKENWRDYHLSQIDEKSVGFLNIIVSDTQAKGVLSSTWRRGNDLDYVQSLLVEKGFIGELIDKTPYLGGQRGEEIHDWISRHPEVEQYVILDDDSDMTPKQLAHHFVWVDRYCGLSPTTAYKATRILNGEANGQFRGMF